MDINITREKALILVEQAYRHQMRGDLSHAIELYRRSIELHPTAEAYTYLGWAYGMQEQYEEAIAACKAAIEVDPDFGNPYNDIGSYLIALERWEEAIPWLEKAMEAPRYEPRHFPYINLGRVHEKLGRSRTALAYYNEALAIDPLDRSARWAKYALLGRLN